VDTAAEHHVEEHERTVTPFELFFDLIFVFGFTQVTTLMAGEPTARGVLRGMLVLAAIWWAWGAYVWLATTIDPEQDATRLVWFGVMGAMLVAALAVPNAFGRYASVFAVCYLIVRTLHLALYALAARGMPALLRNVLLLAPSTMASGLLILGASFLETGLREVIWIIAIGIDYLGPALYDASGWELSPRHFVERHGLIFLIALGESIVALGLAASHLQLDARTIIATMLGLTVVVAMWWTYFDVVAIVAGRRLEQAPEKDQGAMARDSYSYLHMPMVAGVILFALGVKTALPDLTTSLDLTPAAALCGGLTVYLVAHILFRIRNVHSINRPRTVAAAASAALVAVSQQVSGLVLLALVAAVAVTLVTYETVVYREARTRVRASHH